MPDVFANFATLLTTSTSGTTNPVSGTSETWNVATLSSAWLTLAAGNTISIQDANLQSEIIRITALTAGATSITVTRGADSTTPVAHAAGATFTSTVVTSALNAFTYNSGGFFLDQGGAIFNVKAAAYGATGNGSTDDTTAIQAAITAAAVNGGIVFFPQGSFKTNAGITAPNNPNIIYAGTGRLSKIIAGSTNTPFTITGQAFVYDLVFDGGTTAPNAAYQTIVSESSYPSLWKNVVWQNATTYQYVNNGCEDVLYEACFTPGNETAGTPANSIVPSIHIITPFGMVEFHGCKLFGENKLNTQQATYEGGVAGPLVFDSTSLPDSGSRAVLALHGSYIYDAGTTGNACIDTGNNLPCIEANGVIFIMQHAAWFVNGNIPAGAQLSFRGCQWTQGYTTGTSIWMVNASGAGTVVFDGGGVVVDNATTVTLFNGVSSPTTVVQYMNPIVGVTSPTGTGFSTTNSTIDDGSGDLKMGGTVSAGGAGINLHNNGVLQFANSGGGNMSDGSGVPSGGSNGDYYFRTDTPGTANQRIYVKSAGTWVGIV